MKETRTRRLCEWRRRKKRVTGVLNRIWNLLIVFRCKIEFTQMVFDSLLQLCDQWNTAFNRKRKQEHFWIILGMAVEGE